MSHTLTRREWLSRKQTCTVLKKIPLQDDLEMDITTKKISHLNGI